MSFLEEITRITTAAPSIDPEMAGFQDESAFMSAKATERPYHIMDDADVGEPISRDELFGVDSSGRDVDLDAAELLTKGLDDHIGDYEPIGDHDMNSDDEVVSSDVGSGISDDGGSDEDGYNTGDSGDEEVGKEEEEDEDLKMVHRSEDAELQEKKREAVKFQTLAWDKLVQLRLKLQPALQEIGKVPAPEKRAKLMSGDVSQSHRNRIITNIQSALDKLCDIQDHMVSVNGDYKAAVSGKKPVDEDEIPSDTDDEEGGGDDGASREPKRKRKQNSEYYFNVEKERREKMECLKSAIILKWYEQTKVVAKKSAFMNKEVTVLDQISHILSSKERLIDRTIQNRSSTAVFGEGEVTAHPYIFNDDDFYQQLLREIIDKKMGNIDTTDPDSMGKQWSELQKLKIKAKKKSVDTKASKGRKLRYEVHSKLLGFMAPVTSDSLSDERQNELFKSLFTSKL